MKRILSNGRLYHASMIPSRSGPRVSSDASNFSSSRHRIIPRLDVLSRFLCSSFEWLNGVDSWMTPAPASTGRMRRGVYLRACVVSVGWIDSRRFVCLHPQADYSPSSIAISMGFSPTLIQQKIPSGFNAYSKSRCSVYFLNNVFQHRNILCFNINIRVC